MLAAPAASRGKNKNHTSIVTTGWTGATRPSLRNGFNGFLRALPGVPGLLASVACEIIIRKLDPSVGGPGPHDFAVRARLRSSRRLTRPSHPASRFVTIGRNVPLHEAG
jgi:hypothetical protein